MPNRGFVVFVVLAWIATTLAAAIDHGSHNITERGVQAVEACATVLPTGWKYKGCYIDTVAERSLHAASYFDDNMTIETCVAWCNARGYTFAGAEYSRECYCGVGLRIPTLDDQNLCTMKCSGNDRHEYCGGVNRLSVYSNGGVPPVENLGVESYHTLGCYSDSYFNRTLETMVPVPGGTGKMTVALCISSCRAQDYKYSGLEYSGECWCGNSIQNNATQEIGDDTASGCNMACQGNFTETCGGPDRLNLYEINEEVEFVRQGSFENNKTFQGRTAWNPTANNSPDQEYTWEDLITESRKTKFTYDGKYVWSIYPRVDHNTVSHSACLTTEVRFRKAGTYKFSAYIGREDADSDSKGSTILYDVFLHWDRNLASGAVCNDASNIAGPCTVNAANGISSYNRVASTFDVGDSDDELGRQQLSICATFPANGPGAKEYFNVDNVSLLGPGN